jgi:hypothetical protein
MVAGSRKKSGAQHRRAFTSVEDGVHGALSFQTLANQHLEFDLGQLPCLGV